MVQIPTKDEFKIRYPEFSGVADATIEAFIQEASHMVDDCWEKNDQKLGIMALAAHLMTLEGYPDRVSGDGGQTGPINPGAVLQQVVSRRVGDVSVSYAQTSGTRGGGSLDGGLSSTLGLTVYGRTFSRLMKLNVPAIGLV